MKGNKISGPRERTSEIAMHLTIYEMRPDIHAVVHAHPPVATGFATAGRSLNLALLPEVVIGLGCVPLAGYGLPGTPALTEPMLPLIPKYDALLMANHGAVCYGEDVFKAYFRMETMEHFARIHAGGGIAGRPQGAAAGGSGQAARFAHALRREGQERAESRAVRWRRKNWATAAEERFYVTRAELIGLVDEALKARGLA